MARDPKRYRTPAHDRPHLLPDPLAMFCLGCGYPLRGLTAHVCPECGRGFDPKDPGTYSPTAKRLILAVPFDAICAILFASPMAALLYLAFFGTSRWRRSGFWPHQYSKYYSDYLLIIGALFIAALLAYVLIAVPRKKRRYTGDFMIAGVLLVGFVSTWSSSILASMYVYCVAPGMVAVTWWRACNTEAWWGTRIAWCALVITALGVIALFIAQSRKIDDIYDYWTYWVWTTQRF